jgi:hypothetical protein
MRQHRKIKLLRLPVNKVNLVIWKDVELLLKVDDASLRPRLPAAFPFNRPQMSLYQVNGVHAENG